jgi:hypothetical protein
MEEDNSLSDEAIFIGFRNTVCNVIEEIYGKTDKWSTEGNRGPRGIGGVVNFHTINEYLLETEDKDFHMDGGEWSIINYFDTNPKVRNIVIEKFRKSTKIRLKTEEDLETFLKWVSDNKKMLFGEGECLNGLVKANFTGIYNGIKNEKKAFDFVKGFVDKDENLQMGGFNCPGSTLDRMGIDFTVIDNKKGRELKFQAKPMSKYRKSGGKHYIESYNIGDLSNKPVDFFIFASEDSRGIYIFSNKKGEYEVTDSKKINFNYEPSKFDHEFPAGAQLFIQNALSK